MPKIKFEKNRISYTRKSIALLKRRAFGGLKLVGDCGAGNFGKVQIRTCSGRRMIVKSEQGHRSIRLRDFFVAEQV